MQHPAVKSERIDHAFLPPSYYQQQQQLQEQQQAKHSQQQQQQMAPHSNHHHHHQVLSSAKQEAKKDATTTDIESQQDFQSIKGVFGWTVIDTVNIPFILRGDKQFVSVRIVEMKLLSRYPNSYPDDLGKHAPLTSFFVTQNEAKLLNEINAKHCEFEYGKKDFATKELIVQVSDFLKFYELVKKTFPDAASVRAAQIATGWLQIKNTVTPYIRRSADGARYVPLSVIQYAAGLLTNVKVAGVKPTTTECFMLNETCKKAGVEFVFSESSTRLINLNQMLKVVKVEVIELPSSNPLKHATYMELPTNAGVSIAEKPKPTDSSSNSNNQSQTHPYLFQPNTVGAIRSQIQGNLNKCDGASRQQTQSASLATFPNNQTFDPRLITDPRFAELCRMQLLAHNKQALSNGPPNININHSNTPSPTLMNHISPMMQYYMNMQRHSGEAQRYGSQTVTTNGTDPSTISNQSPRSRPPSQTRPPSGPSVSRPPSASPLSPTGSQTSPLGQPPPYSAILDASRVPQINNQVSLQQLQNMHRYLNGNEPTNSQINYNERGASSDKLLSLNYADANHIAHRNANVEIPDLFSPTGSNFSTLNNTQPGPSNPKSRDVPPPLVLMSTAPVQSKSRPIHSIANGDTNSITNVTPSSPEYVIPGPSAQVIIEQPRPQTLIAVAPTASDSVDACIKGAWLNNKSISCLFIDDDARKGQYCLVEAVCKLYFNGCSVNEFLFALENVLNVPLLVCNDPEEKAFIQYYSLPVVELKCNKMIRFEDLERYFPQLTYMFPSKEALDESDISAEQGSLDNQTTIINGVVDMSNSVSNQKRLLSDNANGINPEGPAVKVFRHATGKH